MQHGPDGGSLRSRRPFTSAPEGYGGKRFLHLTKTADRCRTGGEGGRTAIGPAVRRREADGSKPMAIGLVGRKSGYDAHLHGGRQLHSRDGDRGRTESGYPGQDPGEGRLHRHPGHDRYARAATASRKPEAGHFAKAGVPAGRGPGSFVSTVSRTNSRSARSSTVDQFEAGQKVDVTGRVEGQGLRRHDQALELPRSGRHARQLASRTGSQVRSARTSRRGASSKERKCRATWVTCRVTDPESGRRAGRC